MDPDTDSGAFLAAERLKAYIFGDPRDAQWTSLGGHLRNHNPYKRVQILSKSLTTESPKTLFGI